MRSEVDAHRITLKATPTSLWGAYDFSEKNAILRRQFLRFISLLGRCKLGRYVQADNLAVHSNETQLLKGSLLRRPSIFVREYNLRPEYRDH